jgi:hypothetical protein
MSAWCLDWRGRLRAVVAVMTLALGMLTIGTTSVASAGGARGDLTGEPGAPAGVPFVALVTQLTPAMMNRMNGVSWHEGCPLPLDELRAVRMTYWGFDQRPHLGTLIVNYRVTSQVVHIFRKMYDARFPIRVMVPVDRYGGSDDASMAADNTSAFNCRDITGGGRFSYHSWGLAIDIDTVENPYVKGSTVLPPAGQAYLDRSDVRPGLIVPGDVVTRAFAAEGAGWGGDFTDHLDYQHFQWPQFCTGPACPQPGASVSGE